MQRIGLISSNLQLPSLKCLTDITVQLSGIFYVCAAVCECHVSGYMGTIYPCMALTWSVLGEMKPLDWSCCVWYCTLVSIRAHQNRLGSLGAFSFYQYP